ncbi:hypothetical protein [Amycolatopsis sp. CA-230715]|uniref:hypothetical protein n=1 Tax=Amycolatopsis sp. CA-230715 TaxID=2745196 RepID=UPI001C012203|nr:hypothetical protein [Amycolatopsis sp. CA-230715]QWF80994.1 hypothetical protein HUW46_04419 [Amycolatopsis sp. CA-230715]
MLRVMLCGASDTADVRDQFAEVISGLGGEPLHYLGGGIQYLNAADSSWSRNSQITIRAADLCVFVIIERYGEITWSTELQEARTAGKPFLVLCLDRTYIKYEVLRKSSIEGTDIYPEDDRRLVETLRELEFSWQLTIVSFGYGTFQQILRRQLATLFHWTLREQQDRNRRASITRLATERVRLNPVQLADAVRIATDDLEEKNIRKRAVLALTGTGVDADVVLDLLSSDEQGVQRLAVVHLAKLYRDRPADPEFLAQCVHAANAAEDVGIARRLVPVLLELDLAHGLAALDLMSVAEVGIRRRIAESLEKLERAIIANELSAEAVAMLGRCLQDAAETSWKARCRRLRSRLSAE